MAVLSDLTGETPEACAIIKADEWVRLAGSIREETRGRYRIERRSTTRVDPGGINVPYRAWLDGDKVAFGRDGTAEWESLNIFNPPILVPDLTGPIVRSGTLVNGESWELKYREDSVEAVWLSLFRAVQVAGKPGDNIIPGKVASTTSEFRPVAGANDPVDGFVERQAGGSETFANIRAGAGDGSNVTSSNNIFAFVNASTTTDEYDQMVRSIFVLPTGGLPDGDDIDSATLQIRGQGKVSDLGGGDDYGITKVTPANQDDLVNADYNIANYEDTDFATRITNAAWSISGFNTFTLLAAGLAEISKTANTVYALRSGYDIDNSFGGTWASGEQEFVNGNFADATGTTDDPVLTVEHSAGAPGEDDGFLPVPGAPDGDHVTIYS